MNRKHVSLHVAVYVALRIVVGILLSALVAWAQSVLAPNEHQIYIGNGALATIANPRSDAARMSTNAALHVDGTLVEQSFANLDD